MFKCIAAATLAVVTTAVAAPAFAASSSEPFGPVTGYVNLGYSYVDLDPGFHVLDGRVGARVGKYVGVEGEVGFGVGSQSVSGVSVKVKSTYNGYAVGFIPLAPNADLFGRVGYGHSNISGSASGTTLTLGEDSLNFGGGGQYFFTAKDGFRAEYTRYDFRHGNGAANVYSVSYVRRF